MLAYANCLALSYYDVLKHMLDKEHALYLQCNFYIKSLAFDLLNRYLMLFVISRKLMFAILANNIIEIITHYRLECSSERL